MIEVLFEGGLYRFCKSEVSRNYWIGVGKRRGSFHPGSSCVAPLCIWGELQSIAVESGVCKTNFTTPKVEEKPKAARKKKSSKPSISIF